MSKSLIRLVDEAILPAFLIVGSKILGLVFINNILSLRYYYYSIFNFYYSTNFDAITVNTYSDLIVYIVMSIVIIGLLVRLIYFSDNKTDPTVILKLTKINKLGFIKTSIDLYHIIFVWIVFFFGLNIYVILRSLTGIDYWQISIFALVMFLTFFWILAKEIENDIIKKIEIGKETLV